MRQTDARGFTIIELLVVIVVIAILSAVTIIAYSGVQREARDNERKTDIATISRNLEIFYNKNGYYPGIGQLKSNSGDTYAGWRSTNLPDLDRVYVLAPLAADDKEHSIIGDDENLNNPTPEQYQYLPQHSNGAYCGGGSAGNPCVRYQLLWHQEGGDKSVVTLRSERFPSV